MEERNDEFYIREAMRLAKMAEEIDEVPVGALAVRDGEIIATAFNTRESSKCATHHAEILAIERACAALGGWRLIGCDLYVTLEPCPMCAGAIVNARIPRVVYGTKDASGGAFDSVLNLRSYPLCSKPKVVSGVMAEECAALLRAFFEEKRKKLKK